MRYRLIINFSELSQEKFHDKANHISTCLFNNTHYPTPWPAPFPSREQLTDEVNIFNAAYTAAKSRDQQAIAQRNEHRVIVTNTLQNLAHYLEPAARNNRSILESTGYDVTHDPVFIVDNDPPVIPSSITFKRGTESGTGIVHAVSTPNVKQYESQVTEGNPNDETAWGHGQVTEHCNRIVFYGLTPGKVYFARLRGWNKNGWSTWTISSSLMIV